MVLWASAPLRAAPKEPQSRSPTAGNSPDGGVARLLIAIPLGALVALAIANVTLGGPALDSILLLAAQPATRRRRFDANNFDR